MTFREIVRHHRLIGLVGRAIAADSLPPSLILSGPDGVGKRQFALAVAQSLNCVDPVTDPATGLRDACGRCVACGKIVRGNHADVLLVGPDDGGSIKIDVIRQLVGQTAYRPFEGRTRIVNVDQADQMGEDSQNALLKTLEEPPSRNAFILVTSHPDLLLPTIRSRCCQLRFGPLAPAEIASALRNQHGYAERDAKAAAALAHGSLRRALDLGAARPPRAVASRRPDCTRSPPPPIPACAWRRGQRCWSGRIRRGRIAKERRQAGPIAAWWRHVCARWVHCCVT